MKKDKSINVDLVRLIISILVISIHTYPLMFISDDVDFAFTRVFCRICVPFFLMITGYFVMDKALKDKNIAIQYTKKMLIMYAISMVIYLPILIYTGYFKDFSWWLFVKDILFDGFYFHLWYFPALIFGSWLMYFLLKKVDIKVVGVLCFVLYLIGVCGDSYYFLATRIPFVKSFFDAVFSITFYTRNGLFYVPMFLFLGYIVKKSKTNIGRGKYFALGAICLAIMMVEGMVLHHFELPRHTSMYIALVPACYFLFKGLMGGKTSSNKFMRETSTWVYIMHPFIVTGVRTLGNMFHIEIIYQHSLLYFVLVTIITLTFSSGLVYVLTKRRARH